MTPIWIALIAAIPPTLAASFALLLGIMNNRQGKQIHILVNSNLDRVKNELAIARSEILDLRAMVIALLPKKDAQ